MECAGRAKRRRRCGAGLRLASRGSIHHSGLKFAPVPRVSGYIAAWRCASRRTPQEARPPVMDCGGRAKRRHGYGAGLRLASRGSIHHARLKFSPARQSGGSATRSPRRCPRPPAAGLERTLAAMECGGRAKRRHRCGAGPRLASRGSIHHSGLKFAPVPRGQRLHSGVALRFPPRSIGCARPSLFNPASLQPFNFPPLTSPHPWRPLPPGSRTRTAACAGPAFPLCGRGGPTAECRPIPAPCP